MPLSQSESEASPDLWVLATVGENPDDGSDLAQLVVCPSSPENVKGMPVVAAAIGLAPALSGAPPTVARGQARVEIDGGGVRLLYGRDGVLSNPGYGEWKAAAEQHGFALVVCAPDPVTGDLDQFADDAFAHPERLFYGKVLLAGNDRAAGAASGAIAVTIAEGGIAELAAAIPVSEEELARKSQLSGPVQEFFRDTAEPGRAYTVQEIGEAAGIGPEDALPLLHCLRMLAEIGILESGPPAGGHGPTWRRT